MLAMRTAPVTVMEVRDKVKRINVGGEWRDDGVKTHRDGSPVKEIVVRVAGEEGVRIFQADRDYDPARLPSTGETVELAISSRIWVGADNGPDGRPRVKKVDLQSVTEVFAVDAKKAAAA